MRKWLRSIVRGYSDDDASTARWRVSRLPVTSGRPNYVTLRMSAREWRAFFGEGMALDDVMMQPDAVGCFFPSVNFAVEGRGLAHTVFLSDIEVVRALVGGKRGHR